MGCSFRLVGNVFAISWNFYIVSFRKMGFGHQGDVYFLAVEKYFDFFMRWVSPFSFHAANCMRELFLPVC
jgi:hypothetical protein